MTAAMMPPGTAVKSYMAPGTSAGRMGTAMVGGDGGARPMTSNRGAGFSSAPNKKYDPLNRCARGVGCVYVCGGDVRPIMGPC